MNILQISAPKSGSYWLHTILFEILKKKNIPIRSFIQQQDVYEEVKDLELSFKDQAAVDTLDIEDEGCFYRISSVVREPVKDIDRYASSTNLAWTHSTLCTTSLEVLPLFDKKVVIVRDPRDRALSSAKFAFTSYMQKHYPTSYASPEEYFEGEYQRLLEQWVWFVGNYLLHKEELDIHFVFYERLLHDFENEFQSLIAYLETPLSREEQREIANAVIFSSMKNQSPKHLNKGKSGKWVDQLDQKQKDVAVRKAGKLMNWLDYPLTEGEAFEKLPKVPDNFPKQELKELLADVNWYELYS